MAPRGNPLRAKIVGLESARLHKSGIGATIRMAKMIAIYLKGLVFKYGSYRMYRRAA